MKRRQRKAAREQKGEKARDTEDSTYLFSTYKPKHLLNLTYPHEALVESLWDTGKPPNNLSAATATSPRDYLLQEAVGREMVMVRPDAESRQKALH